MRSFDVPEVIEFQEVPLSDEVRMVPESPTATYDSGVVVVVVPEEVVVVPEELELLDESSFFAQEMMVRLKRDMRIMYKTLFIFFLTTKSKILIVGMLVD